MADRQEVPGSPSSPQGDAAPIAPEHGWNKPGTWTPIAVLVAVSCALYANALGNGKRLPESA
jgi:hypothetical protein